MRTPSMLAAALLLAGAIGCAHKAAVPRDPRPHPAVLEAQAHFTFAGHPIPPCFLTDFAGGPDADDFGTAPVGNRISAVAVQGLFDVKESYNDWELDPIIDDNGVHWVNARHREDPAFCFGYRFLGTTPSGVTVVETYGRTGGSGTFLGAMFLRFEMQTVSVAKKDRKDRLVMRFLDEYTWGDRVYRDLKLTGNTLWLGPSHTDIPAYQIDTEPERTVLID